MAGAWKWLNLLVAFALELAAFAALGVWGWHAASTRVVQILLAVGLPLLAVVLWGLFAARNPRYDVPPAATAVKLAVYGAAVAGCEPAATTPQPSYWPHSSAHRALVTRRVARRRAPLTKRVETCDAHVSAADHPDGTVNSTAGRRTRNVVFTDTTA
jgi:4-amino-4-deoxy-L-arabinose transferase-like glycosyltransferase